MDKRTQLRLAGYAVDGDDDIICYGRRHEWVAAIIITLERGGKVARELVERAIAAVDEPRALVGRSREGGAIILLKLDFDAIVGFPDYLGASYDTRREVVTSEGEAVTLTCISEGQTIRVGDWTWPKDRSPWNTERDRLAPYFPDHAKRVAEIFADLKTPAQVEAERVEKEQSVIRIARWQASERERIEREAREEAERKAKEEARVARQRDTVRFG